MSTASNSYGSPRLSAPPELRLVTSPRHASAPPAALPSHSWFTRYQARLRVTDLLAVGSAVTAAFLLQAGTIGASSLIVAAVTATAWLLALAAFRSRDPRVIGVGAAEYKRVASASVIVFGILAMAFLIVQADARNYVTIALPVGLVALLGERWLWRRWLLAQRRQGRFLATAIVVGRRDDVAYVIRQIGTRSGAAYSIVAGVTGAGDRSDIAVSGERIPIIGRLDEAADVAARLGVDAVIVAGQPSERGDFIRELGWKLEGTKAELVLSSRLADIAGPRIHFRPVEGLPLIHVEIPNYEGGRHVLKHGLDIVLSAGALLVFAPLFLMIAIAIKLDDGGPVFFRQDRCGRGGETFRMLKFRSMVTTAERDLAALRARNEGSGVLFKLHDDPRVTRVGKVLRKYSLDELPQLWNILVGDMSVVGPRPPLPTEVDAYESHVHRRLYIKPGLTGMWQVNGRSNLSWEESVRLDLYYVENWSLTGDLVIMWRTLKVFVRPNGAY